MAARKPNGAGMAIGWKWLAGILTSIVLLGGATWMAAVSLDAKDLRLDLAEVKKEIGEKAGDVKEIRKDAEAIKDSQKRQEIRQEKIDDKLDKLKDLIQDERFKARTRGQ